jgi:hypothetical protein
MIVETKITDIDHGKSFGDLHIDDLYFDDMLLKIPAMHQSKQM